MRHTIPPSLLALTVLAVHATPARAQAAASGIRQGSPTRASRT